MGSPGCCPGPAPGTRSRGPSEAVHPRCASSAKWNLVSSPWSFVRIRNFPHFGSGGGAWPRELLTRCHRCTASSGEVRGFTVSQRGTLKN